MATKPETQFIKSVHGHLDRVSVYWMKNHNPYTAGIPDVWYSGHAADLWVEYKYLPIEQPQKPVVPDLSKLQFKWIEGRLKERRQVWVIVGYKKGGVIYKTLDEFEAGLEPSHFVQRTLSRKDLAMRIQDLVTKGA